MGIYKGTMEAIVCFSVTGRQYEDALFEVGEAYKKAFRQDSMYSCDMGGFIQMKYFVTQVNFKHSMKVDIKTNREAITEDHWGIWEATDLQDLCEQLTASSGFLSMIYIYGETMNQYRIQCQR